MPDRRFFLALAAYVIPVFIHGYTWHLVAFADVYHRLGMYRQDILIPLGLASMLIQGVFLAWLFPRIAGGGHWFAEGLRFAAITGVAFWSALVLPVAAKNVMNSVPTFVMIETAFTAVQFLVVGPLIALVYASQQRMRTNGA